MRRRSSQFQSKPLPAAEFQRLLSLLFGQEVKK